MNQKAISPKYRIVHNGSTSRWCYEAQRKSLFFWHDMWEELGWTATAEEMEEKLKDYIEARGKAGVVQYV